MGRARPGRSPSGVVVLGVPEVLGVAADPAVAPEAEPRALARSARTAAATPPGAVRLRNAAAVPLVAFHADPIGAPRGPDRLNRAALGAGDTMEFAPPDDTKLSPCARLRRGRSCCSPARAPHPA